MSRAIALVHPRLILAIWLVIWPVIWPGSGAAAQPPGTAADDGRSRREHDSQQCSGKMVRRVVAGANRDLYRFAAPENDCGPEGGAVQRVSSGGQSRGPASVSFAVAGLLYVYVATPPELGAVLANQPKLRSADTGGPCCVPMSVWLPNQLL